MHLLCYLLFFSLSHHNLNKTRTDTSKYPHDYFSKPLELPFILNANFGDLRSNHFHSGIDLYTNHKTGYNVHAVASGYVSRIKVQSGGYGNALYITHPNGYTSVYGHLEKYNRQISAYLLNAQYKYKTFEIDLYPAINELKVYRNELVATTGDSGFSGGPHLHFEFRNTLTEQIINPLLMGYQVSDHTKPVIAGVYIFSIYQAFGITRLKPGLFIHAIKTEMGNYRLNEEIHQAGKFILGVVANDTHDDNTGIHSVFSVSLKDNLKTIFESSLSHFGFDQTRAVNSYFYYPFLEKSKINVQLSYVDPGNTLPIYEASNQGIIDCRPSSPRKINYLIADVNGNSSELNFKVSCTTDEMKLRCVNDNRFNLAVRKEMIDPQGYQVPLIRYNRDTLLVFDRNGLPSKPEKAGVTLYFKAGCLFDNVLFNFSTRQRLKSESTSSYSNGQVNLENTDYLIGKTETPIKDSVLLGIKIPAMGSEKTDKWVLLTAGHDPALTKEKNGYLYTWIHNFGVFHLEQDLIAPVVTLVKSKKSRFLASKHIAFHVTDKLSGIGAYRATIDDKWVLFEYDAKNHLLYANFDQLTTSSKHRLSLHVLDKTGNTTDLTIDI